MSKNERCSVRTDIVEAVLRFGQVSDCREQSQRVRQCMYVRASSVARTRAERHSLRPNIFSMSGTLSFKGNPCREQSATSNECSHFSRQWAKWLVGLLEHPDVHRAPPGSRFEFILGPFFSTKKENKSSRKRLHLQFENCGRYWTGLTNHDTIFHFWGSDSGASVHKRHFPTTQLPKLEVAFWSWPCRWPRSNSVVSHDHDKIHYFSIH